MNHCFVILHYLAPEVTRPCIDRLLSLFPTQEIVVVDNASPDGSGQDLYEAYDEQEKVHFVFMEHNEGFAGGNNAGYRYAVENLDPDFVIVMNNDVLIEDGKFLEGVEREYAANAFAVLGPDIYSTAEGIHQSPIRLHPLDLKEATTLRRKFALKYKFFIYKYLTWNLKLLLHLATEPKAKEQEPDKAHEGCVLHGACYIFSKDFIAARPLAFNPATFLYCEEDILEFECRKQGLKMRYTPALKVLHLEDASTKAAFESEMKRQRMKYARLVESLDVLIGLMSVSKGTESSSGRAAHAGTLPEDKQWHS